MPVRTIQQIVEDFIHRLKHNVEFTNFDQKGLFFRLDQLGPDLSPYKIVPALYDQIKTQTTDGLYAIIHLKNGSVVLSFSSEYFDEIVDDLPEYNVDNVLVEFLKILYENHVYFQTQFDFEASADRRIFIDRVDDLTDKFYNTDNGIIRFGDDVIQHQENLTLNGQVIDDKQLYEIIEEHLIKGGIPYDRYNHKYYFDQ